MDRSVTKRRRKLNTEQLEVLELLYKFRFGTNDLFAQYFGKKDRSYVYKRLSILLNQGLIGKRFEPGYRLAGKPAAYYLRPAGVRVLQERRDQNRPKINVKTIYKDKNVKDDFVRQCLDIFAVYNRMDSEYGNSLKFFTHANLNYEQFDYFPRPLPDAFIRLRLDGDEKLYFLNIYYDKPPLFAAKKKIKKYVEYAESSKWYETNTNLPAFLAVCESASLQKRLQKSINKLLEDSWVEDMRITTTTRSKLLGGESGIRYLTDDSNLR